MDTINFTDTVSLDSTICHYNIAQLIVSPHMTSFVDVAYRYSYGTETVQVTPLRRTLASSP